MPLFFPSSAIIIIIVILFFLEFSTATFTEVFHKSLIGSKPSQISKTLLSILVDFSNVIFWIVSTCPLISKSSRPFTNPSGDRSKCTYNDWYYRYFHIS